MDRRVFLKVGLGAAVMGAAGTQEAWGAAGLEGEGMLLGAHSPIYEAGPDPELDIKDSITLEAWIKAAPMPQPGGRILDKSAAGTNDAFNFDTFPGNSLRLITARNGALTYDAKLGADHWTHVAAVYSSSGRTMALYVDGREVARANGGNYPPLTVTSIPVRIGIDSQGANRFDGRIRRAAIYRRVLTPAEIAARAAAGPAAPPPQTGVVAEWAFGPETPRIIPAAAGAIPLRKSGADVELEGEAPAPEGPLLVWYRQPAKEWLEAIPIGNGRLGAMVYGGMQNERLQFNEGTLWAGGPHDYANPEGLAALPAIRRLVFEQKWHEAEDLVNAHFMGRPAGQMPYQTVGTLQLAFPEVQHASNYLRQLDLNTAITTASYTADGVRYTREAFASVPDGVIVLRITANRPGCISLTASYNSPQKSTSTTDGKNTLLLSGTGGDSREVPGGVKFCAIARVEPDGGRVKTTDSTVAVTGANAVTILISMATSYRNYEDISGDAAALAREHLAGAARKSYAMLLKAHLADYEPLFHRVSINFGRSEGPKRPTSERIAAFHEGHDPELAALYCQFGRYLLISCSRAGGQPATLQGLWNESLSPPWGSKYTDNINTEMNYWPTAPGNLLECYEPLFAMIAEVAVSGARTAKVEYGAGGWVCHHNTDAWRGTAPVDYAGPGMWPTGGAWLCKSFWDHYQFTGDKAALARHYPLMKGAAQFFLDTLVEEPEHHWLVTNPSVSPENSHHPNANICAGPTMDMEILRDLFDACAEASKVLGKDPEFRAKVMAARARLAPLQIGAGGQLQEWLHDWDALAPDQHHRHVSHLYGLYPSSLITRRGTPELFAAALKSLETRGDMATGWGTAWRLNLWARLEDGDHAYKIVTDLLTPDRTAPNLFDLHPPFQIDGNFGGLSGMMEMILQSHTGELHLLPALPAAWPTGYAHGLLARGGFEVDIDWAGGHLAQALLLSHLGGVCRVRYGEDVVTLETQAGKRYKVDNGLGVAGV